MEKKSVLDQIILCADGKMYLRFLKQIVDDDGTVIMSEPYRAAVASWQNPADVIAFVGERLGLKHAPVSQEDKDWFESVSPMRKDTFTGVKPGEEPVEK